MRLELICSGLIELLVDNNYSPTTINFYKREWKKLNDFLLLEYGDDVFSIDCKSQYKNVGLGQYKNVGFPTLLYCLF